MLVEERIAFAERAKDLHFVFLHCLSYCLCKHYS